MGPRVKPVIAYLTIGLLVLVGTTVAVGAVAFSAGTVRVKVVEKKPGGDRVNLLIPAALIPLCLKFMPDRERERAAQQLRPWLPAIQAASQELAPAGDGRLVEVESRHERVRVVKSGGSLVIEVDSEEETVHVSFPLKLLAWVAAEFERPI
jgi:hypothetical protein